MMVNPEMMVVVGKPTKYAESSQLVLEYHHTPSFCGVTIQQFIYDVVGREMEIMVL